MTALQYRKSIPRYLVLRTLGRRWPSLYTSRVAPIGLRELPEPRLPAPDWVRVRPIMSGICGSDLATLCAKGSAYLSPLTSAPFVVGHEIVGTVTELGPQASGVSVGDRVVVQPALGCVVRGIEPLCDACRTEHPALCRNVTRGCISAGIQTGYCRDTGGGWSTSLVAHTSQLYRVADALDDAVAVLAEPFACSLHAVLRAVPDVAPVPPRAAREGLRADTTESGQRGPAGVRQTALVVGCGSIGLLTIAALRASGWSDRIVAVAKYAHQREHAERLGADRVLDAAGSVDQRYRALAEALNAELYRPELGRPTVIGGADFTFDCVASPASIDDCLRFTTAGGTMCLVGMPGIPAGIDWTTIWFKELTVRASYAYGVETVDSQRRPTFSLALDLLQKYADRLRVLVGEPFLLCEFRSALRQALSVGASRSVKTVFRCHPAP